MVTRGFFRRWAEYRQLIRELKSYSDVELLELGVVRSACAQTAFDATFRSAFGDLRQWLRSWRKHRQTYNELMRLSERELEDLGIRRMDIFDARAQHGRYIQQESATFRLDYIPIIR
jgi:uncharacterized protein YjiS (DUF1127 family)